MRPRLLTFDIFGTVLDWQTGLSGAVRGAGHPFESEDMDRVVDLQGADEAGPYLTYREITRASLVKAFGMPEARADVIAREVGKWPLFPDSRDGMRALMELAPCVAMSNSDFAHGEQVQEQLGFRLTDWVCAEELRLYKPSPRFWHEVARRREIPLDRRWWHVSAYADYDLDVARELGLTCVFIPRSHSRPGWAHHTVGDLNALARLIREAQSP